MAIEHANGHEDMLNRNKINYVISIKSSQIFAILFNSIQFNANQCKSSRVKSSQIKSDQSKLIKINLIFFIIINSIKQICYLT